MQYPVKAAAVNATVICGHFVSIIIPDLRKTQAKAW
jgi:hypothetical protein